MIVVDVNVLLYAVNESEPRHEQARSWLDGALTGPETIGFAWLVLLAFLRISTRPGLFPEPLGVEGALRRVEAWLAQPAAMIVEPTTRHLPVLSELLGAVGAGGNLTSDAHLAALAVEHRATVVTYDTDFSRFPGARWRTPD